MGWKRWAVAGSVALAAAGCAQLGTQPNQAEVVVKERAQARWNAMQTSDYKTAYGYLSPAARGLMPYEKFVLSTKMGFWKSGRVDSVECEKPDVCTVHLTVEYDYKKRTVTSPAKETWIREGSDWWYASKG